MCNVNCVDGENQQEVCDYLQKHGNIFTWWPATKKVEDAASAVKDKACQAGIELRGDLVVALLELAAIQFEDKNDQLDESHLHALLEHSYITASEYLEWTDALSHTK